MSFDGNGTFDRDFNWVTDKNASVKITASRMDGEFDNFKGGLENCVTLTGETTPTANLPMGNKKHTAVANATARDEYTSMGQIQDSSGVFFVTTGSADAYVLTPAPAITAYVAGMKFLIKVSFTNTGASTINISGLGAKNIFTDNSTALVANDLVTNDIHVIVYDGTQFQVFGKVSNGKTQGKETIWVPASVMMPTVSNGSANLVQVETTAARPDMNVLDFDASADEHVQFSIAFPKSWDEGTVTFQALWTTTATDTDGVAWALQGVAVANDDTINVVYGTAVVVTDDNISAAEDFLITAESAAITIAGSPGEDELCFFRLFRDVSDANDDMTEDARLLGIKLFFTTDAANDA